MRYLTFALGKGRLAQETLELFEKVGITCEEMKEKGSRKLIFVNEELKLRFFLAKGPDVPTYVEYGAADMTRYWRKGVKSTRCWIWDSAHARCACAAFGSPRPFSCIMS